MLTRKPSKTLVSGMVVALAIPTVAPLVEHEDAVMPHHQEHVPEQNHAPAPMRLHVVAVSSSSGNVTVPITGVSSTGLVGVLSPTGGDITLV